MPEQERFVRKQGRSKDRSRSKDGGSNYEQALVDYLQERIRPGLNRGAIPLLARSMAKDLANGGSEERLARYLQQRIKPGLNRGAIPMLARSIAHDLLAGSANGGPQHHGEDDGDSRDGSKAKRKRGGDDAAMDFETEMHDLQSELGEDWILRFSVLNDDAWLTAEKTDGSQQIEATTASVLAKAAKLLDRRSGRSSS